MGSGKKSRLKGSGLLRNRNLFQKVPAHGRCVSARCRAVAAQAERYRALNEELIRENAALRAAEKSNREFSVMFDRFLLKMGQSTPYVQGMKKHLELAYDNLGQIETMIDCFADANSLRKFLIGDESFMFEPVQADAKDPPRSPLVKQAPPREHHRFDDEGEIETILEQTTENEENTAMNSPQRENPTFVKAATQCLDTPAVPQRRSSRRSSIGIPRATMERTYNKISLEAPAARTSASGSKNSDSDALGRRTGPWDETPPELSPRSPTKRTTYVKIPQPPRIIGQFPSSKSLETSLLTLSRTISLGRSLGQTFPEISSQREPDSELSLYEVSRPSSSRRTMTVDKRKDRADEDDDTMPIKGKSDEELSLCFERTVTEKLPNIELPQIHEKSPTAINVAQIWANANAVRPLERSPVRRSIASGQRHPTESIASMSIETSPALSSLMNPMTTTQFPSPVLCEKETSLPTSTPAADKAQNHPTTPPEVSIIVAETPETETTETEITIVKNVDCRRRKPNLMSVRNSSPQFSSAIPKSVRFSTAPDDSEVGDRTVTKSTIAKASVSSPFVNRAKNTKIRPTKAVELDRSDEGEVNGTPKLAGRLEEPGTSSQPVPRRTYIKKKASVGSVGRKRSQNTRQNSRADAALEAEHQSNGVGGASTHTDDSCDPPSPKRVRVTSSQAKENLRNSSQRISSLRASRGDSSMAEDLSTDSRRRSRRKQGVSYAEPNLRHKMRRD